jgi:hypothetical protein
MPKYNFTDLQGIFQRNLKEGRPMHFVAQVWHRLGLADKTGRPVTEAKSGLPTLAEDRADVPEDYDLLTLTEAMLGQGWRDILRLGQGSAFPVKEWLRAKEGQVTESGSAPIGPSTFVTVNAWSNVVAGLVQAKILEGYESSEYDIRGIFPTENATVWAGEKLIDILGPMQPADERGPGEPHPALPMEMMFVQAETLRTYGFKLEVTKESAWSDITGGQLLARAKTGGQSLAYRENELALDVLVGTTNNFNLAIKREAATTQYNTYGATINGVAVGNSITNPLTDISSFEAIDNASAQFRHPVYPKVPINVMHNVLVLPYHLGKRAEALNTVSGFLMGTQPGAPFPAAAGTFPTGQTEVPNPYRNRYTIIASRWLDARHREMGLTNAALNRWYALDPTRAAKRRVGWEASIIDLNPNEYLMADRGVIAGQIGNLAVQYQVTSPYHFFRCNGS